MTCRDRLTRLWERSGRQKLVGQSDTQTSLHRCLSTLQLTAIGMGATVGVGIYVLLGVAIKDYAGPGVLLSFILAGLIVLTNAIIFAEYGSRIPHTGASYTYIYCVVGELAAFLTGWMYLLSAACSGAVGARAWSGFVDSLFNNSIQAYLDEKVGQLDLGPPFARSLDWMGFVFYLVVTLLVSFNVNCASVINTVLAVITTGVLIFVTFAGVIIGDVRRLGDSETGGFLPYGFHGVVVGASATFYAFNGFDNICLAAEEAKDPVKSVPRAILIELAIVTLVYCGAAVGTVSLIPYSEIDLRAPIPSAFAYQGVTWARYVVTIGPVIAITNLNILSLFALSRTAYRMAKDGLLFAKFAYINPRTKTPLFGVVVFGILMSVACLFLELKDLVQFSVLCMLFQYAILAPALIALRTSGDFADTPVPSGDAQYMEFEIEVASPSETSDGRSQETTESVSEANGSTMTNGGGDNNGRSDLLQDPLKSNFPYVDEGDLGSGLSQQEDSSGELVPGLNSEPLTSNSKPASADSLRHTSHNDVTSINNNGGSDARKPLGQHSSDEQPVSENSGSQKKSNRSWLKKQAEEEPGVLKMFFRLLTTRRTILMLVASLAGLAAQIGMGWEDLVSANGWAVLATSLLTVLIVFSCEVLRRRCKSGTYEGFKVPLVPYVPALSCFLNMLLLVSAADVMGLVEFAVLICLGFIIYVVMAMTNNPHNDVTSGGRTLEEESYSLLQEDSDSSL